MYGGYAAYKRNMQILKEQGERIDNDPEYRAYLMKRFNLEDLFSRMTEEHWRIAEAKYGYKRDKS